MTDDEIVIGEPETSIIKLCERAVEAIKSSGLYKGERIVVLLTHAEEQLDGAVLSGYDTVDESVVDIAYHLKVILNTVGKDITIFPLDPPSDETKYN